jgi:hypothetical protein
MKEIPLTGKHGTGRVAIVDDSDYERVIAAGPWRGHRSDNTIYAVRSIQHKTKRGMTTTQGMHRFILGLGPFSEDKREGEHADGNGLNNCRSSNLRIATRVENMQNKRTSRSSKTGVKGGEFSQKDNEIPCSD